MKMTFNEALETIKGERWIDCSEKYREAMNLITDTVNKYQKVQEIIIRYDATWEFHHMKPTIDEIRKVIEDGNDD